MSVKPDQETQKAIDEIRKTSEAKSEPAVSGAYGYSNAGIICGYCSYFMDSSVSDTRSRPIILKAKCINRECKNFDKVFRVGDAAKIPLIEE